MTAHRPKPATTTKTDRRERALAAGGPELLAACEAMETLAASTGNTRFQIHALILIDAAIAGLEQPALSQHEQLLKQKELDE